MKDCCNQPGGMGIQMTNGEHSGHEEDEQSILWRLSHVNLHIFDTVEKLHIQSHRFEDHEVFRPINTVSVCKFCVSAVINTAGSITIVSILSSRLHLSVNVRSFGTCLCAIRGLFVYHLCTCRLMYSFVNCLCVVCEGACTYE